MKFLLGNMSITIETLGLSWHYENG